jgi:hypothetical protein
MTTKTKDWKLEDKENVPKAIFELLLNIEDKVTKINNKFDRMAKELGYKI